MNSQVFNSHSYSLTPTYKSTTKSVQCSKKYREPECFLQPAEDVIQSVQNKTNISLFKGHTNTSTLRAVG